MPQPAIPRKSSTPSIAAAKRQAPTPPTRFWWKIFPPASPIVWESWKMSNAAKAADLGLRVFVGNRVAMISSSDFSDDASPLCRSAPSPWRGWRRKTNSQAWRPPNFWRATIPGSRSGRQGGARAGNSGRARPGRRRRGPCRSRRHQFRRRRRQLLAQRRRARHQRTAFFGRYAGTSHNIGVAVLAGEGTGMERDYDHASARQPPICERRGDRQKRRRTRGAPAQPPQGEIAEVPVVFDPRDAGGCSAISPARSPARRSRAARVSSRTGSASGSFAPGITVIDDPHRLRGLRSKPFDGEGVANASARSIEEGVLHDLAAGSAPGAPAGSQHHRPCRARHRRAARAVADQSLYRARRGHARRN